MRHGKVLAVATVLFLTTTCGTFAKGGTSHPAPARPTIPSKHPVCYGQSGTVRRRPIIKDYGYTITERPDRAPGSGCLPIGNGKYRYLTERECWRLQGYNDEDFEAAAGVNSRRALYKQAGNSIPVPIFESIFSEML